MENRFMQGLAAVCAASLLSLAAPAGVLREAVFDVGAAGPSPAVGETMRLPSFDGGEVLVELTSRSAPASGVVSYCGRTVGSSVNNVSVVETGAGFVATVVDRAGGGVFRFRLDGSSLSVREEARPAPGRCGTTARRRRADRRLGRKESGGPAALTGDPLVDGAQFLKRGESATNVVDVMVCVDLSAKRWIEEKSAYAGAGNAVDLFAADCIARCNNMYANTGLDRFFTFSLAGSYELDIDCSEDRDGDGDVDSEIILKYLSGEEDPESAAEGMKYARLRLARDRMRADIVSLLVSCGKDEPAGTVGIGWALADDTISEREFAEAVCNVCLVESVAIGNTMAHEIGHNMGAGHAKMSDPDNSGPQLYGYSTGYYFDVTNSEGAVFMHAGTVMAYDSNGYDEENSARWGAAPEYASDPELWNAGMYTETGFFSSPNHTFKFAAEIGGEVQEVDSGVLLGTETNDNTRILSLTYPLVANFRARGEELLLLNEAANVYDYALGAEIEPLALTCDFSERPSITATNLPPGLVFDEAAWTVSGTPTSTGEFKVDFALETSARVSEQSVLVRVTGGPGTITATTERAAAGGVLRVTLHRTGGSEGRIAVKVKTQTSTGVCGTDFDYVKRVFVWEDGDSADKVLEIPTYASGAGKLLRVKLATLTTGEYEGCAAPVLAESKVYAEIEVPRPGIVAVTAPTPLSVIGGDVLRMRFSRVGGSDGNIAVKAKTQTSTAVMGVDGSADFDYVKSVLEWADGDSSDRYLDIPTYVKPWEGTRALRVKLATLSTGAYAGNLVPALAETKIYADIVSPSMFGTVSVEPAVARPAAGEVLRLVFRRTGGSDWPIAVKYKVQTSTAVAGADFEYKKGVVTWADGESDDRVVEVTTYPSAAGKQLRVKLSTLTQGDYQGCVTPHLKEAKVYVQLYGCDECVDR